MENKSCKTKGAFRLFRYFFRISWFTFGGGWSLVAQMKTDLVEKERTISEEELMNIVSVGRSLPGLMVSNTAYLYGYHIGGILCGVCSVVGIILPPMIILTFLTYCYTAVSSDRTVVFALTGIRACVPPIILSAVLGLQRKAFPRRICYLLFAGALFLYWRLNVSCFLIVLLGAAAGLALPWKDEEEDQ